MSFVRSSVRCNFIGTIYWLELFKLLHLKRGHFLAHVFECSLNLTKFVYDAWWAVGSIFVIRALSSLTFILRLRLTNWWDIVQISILSILDPLCWLLSWNDSAWWLALVLQWTRNTIFLEASIDWFSDSLYIWLCCSFCLSLRSFVTGFQELLFEFFVLKFKVFANKDVQLGAVSHAKSLSFFFICNLTCLMLKSCHF